MDYLPIFLRIKDKPVLVVGGGEVALRKIELLRKAGARVTVAAPELCPAVHELAQTGEITHLRRNYATELLGDCVLVVAATNNRPLNAQVSADAQARRIPVNVVDDPELCSFVTPSIVDRSPVIIAVSSGGGAPVLARLLRARLEALIPAAYGRLAALALKFRTRVAAAVPNPERRRRFWEGVFSGAIGERVLAGHEAAAERALVEAITAATDKGSEPPQGEVYLVGGGPGDPDLLTLRALRLMQQADVVLFDHLISPPILDLVRRDAERIDVGKRADKHTKPQEEINELLVRLAGQGKRVLRLKGGDPFVFGRGGEEIEHLAEAGIPFQVVPGITAANGCGAYAGIPLTHRDHAQSVCFVTAHLQKDGGVLLNWDKLVVPKQTLVVYMGLKALPIVCERLLGAGMAPDTPAALVEEGTTAQQRVIVGTVASLPATAAQSDIRGASLTIIGTVVTLRDKLNWFG
ncbi:MAG: siroheme synthase CysG [Nevskiales bacterium]